MANDQPIRMPSPASNPYQTQAILTAPPSALVVKLYEAAIHQLRKVVRAISAGDIESRYNANWRAFEIIEHLLYTLNLEKGGQIADNLSKLYIFMLRRLVDVDLHNDPKPASDVITLLEPLYQAWRKLDEQSATRQPAAPAEGAKPDTVRSVA